MSRMRAVACFGVRLMLLAGVLTLLAGWLGRFVILLDFANLVILPAAIAILVAAAILLMKARGWPGRIMLGGCAVLAAISLIPPAAGPQVCPADAETLRIAWLNTESVDDADTIMAWVEREDPAVIALGEVSSADTNLRAALAARYPHKQSCMAHDRCPTIIYASAKPLAAQGLARGDAANRRALSAAWMEVDTAGDTPLRIVAAHLSHPAPLGQAGQQDAELAQLQAAITSPANTVVIGDFNATRRMHVLRRFAGRNMLLPAASDKPTWPLNFIDTDGQHMETTPLWQIDHVLTGRNWAVKSLRTSSNLGSDHRGLVADLCQPR